MNTQTKFKDLTSKQPSVSEVIRCEELTKQYPAKILAVDRLNLSVQQGEIFGLLGPNGAGKTTTVGMLTSLVIPTGGKAFVSGINVVTNPSLVKQVIGVVSQTNNLDRSLNVWENLYYHARFFGLNAKQAREASDKFLVEFRLKERAKADVMTISGGMAKRLMVARALLHQPSVLFLDEPTAGLDPQSRLALWEILRKLHKEGQTILLTTHYMEEADSVCDRLAIIDHGHLLALGTPASLKESVGADTIVTITATGNLDALASLLKSKIQGATRTRLFDKTIQLHIKGANGVLPKVVTVAEEGGYKITDLSIDEPTLETVFISLTGKDLRE
ncbi:MAG: ATP-binding cassette domain-containing protein [Chloroflexi bacterium]|nr:ATP-binding cassette domain-containing protein [Chloroflexota bacterium]